MSSFSISTDTVKDVDAKRAEVVAKLQRNALERQQAKEQQQASQQQTSIQQQLDQFHAAFEQQKKVTENSIISTTQDADPTNSAQKLIEAEEQLISLQSLLNSSSHYLPAYDLTSLQNSINQLEQLLNQQRQQITPKKKFAFKQRAEKAKKQTTDIVDITNGDVAISPASSPSPSPSPSPTPSTITSSAGFHNLSNRTLMLSRKSLHRDLAISHLTDCTVMLCGISTTLRFSNLSHCRIYCGPVIGSIHIEHCSNSIFILASHQLRIHSSHQNIFYLYTVSHPIIEHCDHLIFSSRYCFYYPGSEDDRKECNMIDEQRNAAREKVEDFNWLRQQQSPHWRWSTTEEDQAAVIRIDDNEIRVDPVESVQQPNTSVNAELKDPH